MSGPADKGRPAARAHAPTEKGLHLRPARRSDAELLLGWVNSPDSLAAKLETKGPIAWEAHLNWLEERLADPYTALWIAEREGRPIGQLRLQRRSEGEAAPFDVDIYLLREERGQGHARAMLEDAIARVAGKWPGAMLRALVRKENAASRALFEAAGFRREAGAGDGDGHLVFLLGPLEPCAR